MFIAAKLSSNVKRRCGQAVKECFLKVCSGVFKQARGLQRPTIAGGDARLKDQAHRLTPVGTDFLEPLRVIFDLGTHRSVSTILKATRQCDSPSQEKSPGK